MCSRVIAQAVAEAQARSVNATIAVVDRVGNVLAVYRMGDRGDALGDDHDDVRTARR